MSRKIQENAKKRKRKKKRKKITKANCCLLFANELFLFYNELLTSI